MVKNQLVYLAYGNNQNIITEVTFSIVSAIHRSTSTLPEIVIVTDTEQAFSSLPVKVIPIVDGALSQWYGPDNYNHRSKPCALLSVFDRAEKSILIDSDTYFLQDPALLFDLINENTILVDRLLQKFDDKGMSPYIDACPIKYGFELSHRCVNSGLIGLTRSNKRVVEDTVQVIDEMYTATGRLLLLEQVALGIAAQHSNLIPVAHSGVIRHYYARKHIHRAYARTFLEEHQDLFSDQTKKDVENYASVAPELPVYAKLAFKIKARSLPNANYLRRFYLEIKQAIYPYKRMNPHVRDEMLKAAMRSLFKNNKNLFITLKKQGIESVFNQHYLSDSVLAKCDNILKEMKV